MARQEVGSGRQDAEPQPPCGPVLAPATGGERVSLPPGPILRWGPSFRPLRHPLVSLRIRERALFPAGHDPGLPDRDGRLLLRPGALAVFRLVRACLNMPPRAGIRPMSAAVHPFFSRRDRPGRLERTSAPAPLPVHESFLRGSASHGALLHPHGYDGDPPIPRRGPPDDDGPAESDPHRPKGGHRHRRTSSQDSLLALSTGRSAHHRGRRGAGSGGGAPLRGAKRDRHRDEREKGPADARAIRRGLQRIVPGPPDPHPGGRRPSCDALPPRSL